MATDGAQVTLRIDDREVTVPKGTLIIEAAHRAGIHIPFFCYHPKMKTAAACRMCLVEIEKIPKLQPSCQIEVAEGMVVHTTTPRVRQAQRGVLEFTLINHPLDCPICDKGGECQLQDLSFNYGASGSRFVEQKVHKIKAYPLGPLVMLDQERCINCSRCIRFCEEIAGDPVLTFQQRGGATVVETFEGRTFDSRFSGNTIELCPVGALTSRPYRFNARPWDVSEHPSVCPHCPVGCNITLTVRDNRVLRVLSRTNDDLDNGWLCDRGQFGYGFLTEPRPEEPLLRGPDGTLRPATWEEALAAVRQAFAGRGEQAAALGGGRSTTEAAYLLQRYLREVVGSPHVDHRLGLQRVVIPPGPATRVADLDDAHAIVLLECDPMEAAPVVALRIRQASVRHRTRVFALNAVPLDQAPYEGLEIVHYAPGEGAAVLEALARHVAGEPVPLPRTGRGRLEELREALCDDGKVVFLWNGQDESLAAALSRLIEARGERPTGILVPGETGNARGAEEAGMSPGRLPGGAKPERSGLDARGILEAAAAGEITHLFLLDADPLEEFPDQELAEAAIARVPFLVVATSQRRPVVERAHAVLPVCAFAETSGSYVNLEGRAQLLQPAVDGPGLADDDWRVVSQIAKFGFRTAEEVRQELSRHIPGYGDPLGDPARVRREALHPRFLPDTRRPLGLEGRLIGRAEPLVREAPAGGRGGEGLRLVADPALLGRGFLPEPYLAAVTPAPYVALSPEDAQELGVGDGETVEVAGRAGALELAARINPRIPPGVAYVPRGLPGLAAGKLLAGGTTHVTVRALALERRS